jgi:HlyD family secretion protein
MKPNPRLIVPVVALVAIAVVVLSLLARRDRGATLFASGTVEATEAHLGFATPGRLDSVAVREGDPVRAGEEIAALDLAETEARLDQARAQVAAAQAQLLELERGSRPEEVAQARSAMEAARDRLADAERDLERTARLKEGGAVSQETHDKALLGRDVARSQFAQAEEQWKLVRDGPRPERIAAARAQLAQARAAARALEAALANMTVRSAFDGVVTVRHREPGEVVPAGSPVLTVMNRDDRWVKIYVPETRIGAVRLGLEAEITTDTFPGKTYGGTVSFIASEAEFTPKTVQTSEERVKLVYAVKVTVAGDPSFDLKPGMPAAVRLALARP